MFEKKDVRVAVIAAGGRSQGVMERLLRDSERHVRIVSVYDPDPAVVERALARWETPGAARCASMEEAVAFPGVEWVMVFSPNAFHKEAILEGFRMGKNVFSEKPLATTLEDCRAVYDAWRASGKLFATGKYDMSRLVAVTGPEASDPCYVQGIAGMQMDCIADFRKDKTTETRFISGDVLTGTNVGEHGFLGFYDNQVTLIEEGNKYEMLGWAKPFRTSLFSFSHTYFSWLTPNKKYEMDTNLHGGPRAFVMSDVYGKVLPMDIYPVYLIKACLAGDIDKMEKFGIYEVLEEDLALCEYVCPSKVEIQSILSDGINLMMKEMA